MRTLRAAPHELVLMLAATAAALAAQTNPPNGPENAPKTLTEAWRAGLQQMRSQHAPGIVFVLPEADPQRERLLATVLVWLDYYKPGPPTRDPYQQLMLVLALAVPVFAAPETCGAKPGETLLLLKPDGTRAEGFAVDLGNAHAVALALTPRLLSEAAIAAQLAVVPPALQRDVELVTRTERQGLRSAEECEAWRRVQQRQHEAAPALVQFVDVFLAGDLFVKPPERMPVASDSLRRLLAGTAPLGTVAAPVPSAHTSCGLGRLASPGPGGRLLKLLPK